MDDQGNEHVEELDLQPVAVVRKRRPRALWAVLAVVGVAAGALVVTSADEEGNQRPGLPVDLAGASRGSGAEAAADAMSAWITYVPGDDLPALGGEATAYRLPGQVTEDQVRQLAEALGLEAAPVEREPGVWTVAVTDGGQLDVFGPGWSYHGAGSGCATDGKGGVTCELTDVGVAIAGDSGGGSAGCADDGDCAEPTTTTSGECTASDGPGECLTGECAPDAPCPSVEEPIEPPDTGSSCVDDDCIARCEATGECNRAREPSPDLPDEAAARDVALGVVAASGPDVDGAVVTADAGFDSWYISVETVLDGVPSGLTSFVEVGPELVVRSGGGFIGVPEALGDYPRLDTRAAIERANQQMDDLGAGWSSRDANASSGEGTTGGTDTGGTDDVVTEDVDTTIAGTDPCAAPDGASDGCGGTTGCGGDGCVAPSPTVPCKVQADGSEICEYEYGCLEGGEGTTTGGTPDGSVTTVPCDVPTCPPAVSSDDLAVGVPESLDCTPPPPDPGVDPMPEPEPLEIVLVDAEPALAFLLANDGSPDGYLVPAYRFTAEDGSQIDLPAVSDEALTGQDGTASTVPDTVVPEPAPEPQPCEVLEEEDASGTTHTIQTCPTPNEDPQDLGEGEEPAIGVGYYVDVNVGHCSYVEFADWFWVFVADGTADPVMDGWATPTEGGTFTLESETEAIFVGDAEGTKVGRFTRTSQDGIACA